MCRIDLSVRKGLFATPQWKDSMNAKSSHLELKTQGNQKQHLVGRVWTVVPSCVIVITPNEHYSFCLILQTSILCFNFGDKVLAILDSTIYLHQLNAGHNTQGVHQLAYIVTVLCLFSLHQVCVWKDSTCFLSALLIASILNHFFITKTGLKASVKWMSIGVFVKSLSRWEN